MDEHSGWLLDIYAREGRGITLWLLGEDGSRLHLSMDFPVTFYAAGDFESLRQAWVFLKEKGVELSRTRRRDLFSGEREVMAVTTANPGGLPALFREASGRFPTLDYYDADIPLGLRFIARMGVHLLGRCRLRLEEGRVQAIEPLDSPWELEPVPIPLRVLCLSPDVDPARRPPDRLRVRYERVKYALDLEPRRAFLIGLRGVLRNYDPDLILTDYGDTWLFPQLRAWCKESGVALNPNRDPDKEVLTRRADSYFAYGQVIHRGAQTHLFGRWHIDRRNALLFGEYDLEGVLEQVRVTGLGVQEMARKSPGAGITAMQMTCALRLGVLVPVQKQQAEGTKSLTELTRADRGGLIYQPIVGVHGDVAQVDFSSMYPSIIVRHNISPETVAGDGQVTTPPGETVNPAPEGLVPQTLRPLLEKRLRLKELLLGLNRRDCRLPALQARAAALKWLLVVCFGYLGYKNARFGKIESHEAVTATSRELILQAKETAEEMGFTVLHMYVDSLFVQKEDLRQPEDFSPLLEAITAQTGLPIALEGVYRWVAFLPSRRDGRIPVPNRYFGVFRDGSIKYRGIEVRRRDTPPWVGRIQLAMLGTLAEAETLEQAVQYLPKALAVVERSRRELKAGKVPQEELVVTQKLSRAPQDYTSPSPAARAARQLQAAGRSVAAGQFVRFLYARQPCGVQAWDLQGAIDTRLVDTERYGTLLDRAAETVLELFKPVRERMM